MKYDRILFLLAGLFFIMFSFVIRFVINDIIRKSNKRTEENTKRKNYFYFFVFNSDILDCSVCFL